MLALNMNMNMEPPAKRARVGNAPWHDDDDDDDDEEEANADELTFSASQFNARQDPMYKLDKKRAKSAFKLKSRFEDIFEKYGKDFEETGDEIDLYTGEIIVDNGHLQSLEDENEDKSEDEEERRPRSYDTKIRQSASDSAIPRQSVEFHPAQQLHNGWRSSSNLNQSLTPRSQLFAPPNLRLQYGGRVDPAWQTPEMQLPFLADGTLPRKINMEPPSVGGMGYAVGFGHFGHSNQSYRRIVAAKEVGPRALQISGMSDICSKSRAQDSEVHNGKDNEDDEDDLRGTSEDFSKTAAQHHFRQGTSTAAALCMDLGYGPKSPDIPSGIQLLLNVDGAPRRRGRPKKRPTSPLAATEALNLPTGELNTAATTPIETDSNLTGSRPKPKITQTGALQSSRHSRIVKGRRQVALPATDGSSDSQCRRSSRVLTKPQRYSPEKWNKLREIGQVAAYKVTPPETNNELPEEATPKKQSRFKPGGSRCPARFEVTLWNQDYHVPPRKDHMTKQDNPTTEAIIASVLPSCQSDYSEAEEMPAAQADIVSLSQLVISESQTPTTSPSSTSNDDEIASPDTVITQPIAIGKEPKTETNGIMTPLPHLTHEWKQLEVETSQENISGLVELAQRNETLSCAGSARISSSEHGSSVAVLDDNKFDTSIELGEPLHVNSGSLMISVTPDSEPVVNPTSTLEPEPMFNTNNPEILSSESTSQAMTSTPLRSPRPRRCRRSPISVLPICLSTRLPVPSPELGALDEPVPDQNPVSRAPGPPVSVAPPTSRYSRTKESPMKSNPRTPRKTRTLASLITDASDDEHELSILSSSVARTPTSNASIRASFIRGASHTPSYISSSPRQSRQHSVLVSTPSHLNTRRASSRHASPALPKMPHTDTGAIRHGLKRNGSTLNLAQSSPLARSVLTGSPQKGEHSDRWTGAPTDSLARTPGGTTRHCGKDGFVCDREFCFACCQ